jgi:hypothetical protein
MKRRGDQSLDRAPTDAGAGTDKRYLSFLLKSAFKSIGFI